MPLDRDLALALEIAPVEQTYVPRDVQLYALGLGVGADPLDPRELDYVHEQRLKVLPTMPVTLAFTSIRDLGLPIDYGKIVHGEQSVSVHAPLPVAATVVGRTRVVDLIDRGAGKGALLYLARSITDKATGTLLASSRSTVFCRGDGGFGGPPRPTPPVHALPERAPDGAVDVPTLPQAALLYRLSGDWNPLHVDPDAARKVGFERPILHGLATFGIAGRALLRHVLGDDVGAFGRMDGRFSSPVYPGDTIRIEWWLDGAEAAFRASVPARDVVVLNNGRLWRAGGA